MSDNRLGRILLDGHVITEAQLAEALLKQRETGELLGDTLIALSYVTQKEIAQALSVQLEIPFFDLDKEFHMKREDIKLIPESVARRYRLIPIKESDDPIITIVMRDPLDIEAFDTVRSLTKMEVHKAIGVEDSILKVIDREYRPEAHIEGNLKDIIDVEEQRGDLSDQPEVDAEHLRIQANDAPVVRYVNLLLMQAVRDRASDIHFEPGEADVNIRLRIDGLLREITPPPKNLYQAVVTRVKILSEMDIAERRLPLDGRFKFKVKDREIDIRASSLPVIHGEKLVLRVLDRQAVIVDLTAIGFEENILKEFHRILKLPHGIILLTGPTGSGKTTTLYSALNYLRSPEKNFQTVEDPVEYSLKGINQMPVRAKIGLSFSNALRAILRQDPDVIMIGEIRDEDTARIAMRASLTGHLVLSTLHTNDATSAFSRLKDMGIEPYLVAASVKLVIAQRLLRRICEHCKKEVPVQDNHLEILAPICAGVRESSFYKGDGCEKCGQTGYHGRSAALEFMEVGNDVREMIINGVSDRQLRRAAIDHGMEELIKNGLNKARRGVTTIEEVISVWPAEYLS